MSPDHPASPIPSWGAPPVRPYKDRIRRFGTNAPNTASSIIAQFKSIVTKRIRAITGNPIDVWQRNYYERIIQTNDELFDTIEYIKNNPRDWGKDDL